METRTLGRTGRDVGVVGLGCWQLGGDWGHVEDDAARATLEAATGAGVTFLDTADVYGDGTSERRIAAFLATSEHAPFVATKVGRRADPHVAEEYSRQNLRAWVDASRHRLGVDLLDLVQLHCPPAEVYADDTVFDTLDELAGDGALAHYGVSVETCDQALAAIARPGVATVQIILNAFRRKPLEHVLPAAREAGVGIIARVPLASGLLTGRYDEDTTFPEGDHRTFNRHGESFDVGETFAGVPFEVGVQAAREVADVAARVGVPTVALALRWVVDQPGVSVVIPGARDAGQALGNASATDVPPLPRDVLEDLERIYDNRVREHVHDRW